MSNPTFAILITTKNRKVDLGFTLNKISYLLIDETIDFVIFDDGSDDGTFDFVKYNYPKITIYRNEISKGYLFCRNTMLNNTKAAYAISLDDDAHFVTENPLESIKNYFNQNPNCGLVALRIFWGLEEPISVLSVEKSNQVQGFVGCAHVWRTHAWRDIPNYPEWFIFYGEEEFASYQLFKKGWEVHYLPEVLVNHRVNIKSRKSDRDYTIRLRSSLRSGWYLFFLFYPLKMIPRKMLYSIWMQLKLKVFVGDFMTLKAIGLALLDLVVAIPKIVTNSNRLTQQEYDVFQIIEKTKIYWSPKEEKLE